MNMTGREKVLVLENWSRYVGINPTTHSNTDKLAGITSLSTNCTGCHDCIVKHSIGQDAKNKKAALKKEIKKQDLRIERQLMKCESDRNQDILTDAYEKRSQLVKECNDIKVPVCAYCFAFNLLNYHKNIQPGLTENSTILSSRVLDGNEIPFINRMVFRFESFGDLINEIHAANYIRIAIANPHCTFAWWTKKPYLMKAGLQLLGLDKMPDNIVCILSSYYVNHPQHIDRNRYPFIKVVFTVFDSLYLESHPEITISCGTRQCLGCMKCYTRRSETDDILYINEKVK